MFNIETFINPVNYYKSIEMEHDSIHIFPVKILANHMQSKQSKSNNSIISYPDFESLLFSDWNNPYIDLYLRAKIRKLIVEVAPADLIPQMNERIKDILLSVRFLVDLQLINLVKSNDLSRQEHVFTEIMERLCNEEVLRSHLKVIGTLTKETILNRLNVNTSISKVYVYQLDYIDATRMMMFFRLQRAGFTVVFRIPYEQKLLGVYKGWKNIYESLLKKSDEEWSVIHAHPSSKGQSFANYLDGKGTECIETDLLDIKLFEFEHPINFKKYVQNENDEKIIAVNDEHLNKHIGINSSNQFFATSYGKFLMNLKDILYIRDKNTFRISYEKYIDLITSGWIEVNGVSGMRGSSLLQDLVSYMDGITSIDEIKDRLMALIELQDVSKTFDSLSKDQSGSNRVKRYLLNPFRVFPYVHQHRYDLTIKQLLDLTRDLERKLSRLVIPIGDNKNVNEYIDLLIKIYNSVKSSWPQEICMQFEERMKFHLPENWVFEQEEMHQLVILRLGGDQQGQRIQPFSNIRGLILKDEPLHLTDLSMHSFPEHNTHLPYFLSHSWLKKSIQRSFISANKDIRMHALVVDYQTRQNGERISIYNLYSALAFFNGELKLSWIKKLTDNESASIYYTIVKKIYNSDYSNYQTNEDVSEFKWKEAVLSAPINTASTVTEQFPDLYWLDFDFCAKKFFYTAVLSHQPIYENDFHQKLAFGILGQLFSQQGEGRKEFEESIFPLFPQWTNALKHNLIDTEYKRDLRDYKQFQNVSFPKAMQQMQKLRSQYEVTKRWKIRNQYKENRFKEGDVLKEFGKKIEFFNVKAEPGSHCRMCPHLHICTEGEYVIDE